MNKKRQKLKNKRELLILLGWVSKQLRWVKEPRLNNSAWFHSCKICIISFTEKSRKCKLIYNEGKQISGCLGRKGLFCLALALSLKNITACIRNMHHYNTLILITQRPIWEAIHVNNYCTLSCHTPSLCSTIISCPLTQRNHEGLLLKNTPDTINTNTVMG